jgi:transcription-repair coupling factor (superfamily II helicase)
MHPLLAPISEAPSVGALALALSERQRVVATGVSGSATAMIAGAVATKLSRPVVLVVAHLDDADEAMDELLGMGIDAIRLPAMEAAPGETGISSELFAERLTVIREVVAPTTKSAKPRVVIAPIAALMQLCPAPTKLGALLRTLETGKDYKLSELGNWLVTAGYRRVEAIEEPGDYAQRGGILDIFPPGTPALRDGVSCGTPVRLDFFGDTLDRVSEIDLESMGSDRKVNACELVAVNVKSAIDGDANVNFLELLPRESVALLAETLEVVEQGRGYFERVIDAKSIVGPPAVLRLLESRFHALGEINQFSAGATGADVRIELPSEQLPALPKDVKEALAEAAAYTKPPENATVLVCCSNEGEEQRLGELLAENDLSREHFSVLRAYLHRGFLWRAAEGSARSAVVFLPYHELISRFTVRRRAGRLRSGRAMDTFLDFQSGEYVVHTEHGIARFVGLQLMKPRELPLGYRSGAPRREQDPEEYLVLEFAAGSKLYVPATQIDKVQKYVGGFAGKPPLSTLGGQKWQNQKDRVAASVKDLAAELLRVRAAREHLPGIQYPGDTPWMKEFEDEFPYEETQDQLAAIGEIKKDMGKPRPMDRLICGDVGFGKTEVAIRAAFKAVEFGKQVAVVVPTTVLAEQHERTFKSRFAGYPFKIDSVSRFKSDAEIRETLVRLRKGQVDVIVGTHRLFSQDVNFADLGLVIIDEEQRFGVEHKESLLRMRLTVDVLTLSATPIPRTLHMAMLGIRDISSLTTAPLDRRAIVTEVIPYNPLRIKAAIERELAREGQVYFVHNRVHDILSVADNIQKLAPEAKIVVGHGQMPPNELEEVMMKFLTRQADILVATTIIESGIDIATANTMIINDADRFGLADLHQLRGRVGRSKNRAYCYLLLPNERTVKEIAQKRLKAIEQYSMLGAGFKIAMRDLEIRGAGNILGPEQSGHIAAVGYEMYCQLLETSVHELKNEKPPITASQTSVEIGVSGLIPQSYIPSEARRLEAYRRLATAPSIEQLQAYRKDLTDAYGEPPKPTQRLLDLAELRIALSTLSVTTATIRERDVVFRCDVGKTVADAITKFAPKDARGELAPTAGTVRTLPPKHEKDQWEVYFRPPENYLEPDTLLLVLRQRLGLIMQTAPTSAKPAASGSKPSSKANPKPR